MTRPQIVLQKGSFYTEVVLLQEVTSSHLDDRKVLSPYQSNKT